VDWLTFLATIVQAVAWPVTIVAIAYLLRKELRALIPLLTKLKYKDIELEFGRRVEQLETQIAIQLPETTPSAILSAQNELDIKLAEVSPRSAVLEAWRELELAALKRAKRSVVAAGGDPSKVRPREVLQELQRDVTLSPFATRALPIMRELRNRAAHAPEFALSSESAITYVTNASRIAREMEAQSGV
jgi:hypothetical protein